MYQQINVDLAKRLGIPAALAAGCLMDAIEGKLDAEVEIAKGDVWVRMGHKTLALFVSFITNATAKRALKHLVDLGICKTEKLSESPFDHTYYYALTDYGHQLLHSAGMCDIYE